MLSGTIGTRLGQSNPLVREEEGRIKTPWYQSSPKYRLASCNHYHGKNTEEDSNPATVQGFIRPLRQPIRIVKEHLAKIREPSRATRAIAGAASTRADVPAGRALPRANPVPRVTPLFTSPGPAILAVLAVLPVKSAILAGNLA